MPPEIKNGKWLYMWLILLDHDKLSMPEGYPVIVYRITHSYVKWQHDAQSYGPWGPIPNPIFYSPWHQIQSLRDRDNL